MASSGKRTIRTNKRKYAGRTGFFFKTRLSNHKSSIYHLSRVMGVQITPCDEGTKPGEHIGFVEFGVIVKLEIMVRFAPQFECLLLGHEKLLDCHGLIAAAFLLFSYTGTVYCRPYSR